MTKPLAVTMGDPAGIGLDIIISAWRRRKELPPFYLVAPPSVLLQRAALLDASLKTQTIGKPSDALDVFHRALPILPIDGQTRVTPGKPSVKTAGAVTASIELAVEHALTGKADGVVTAPISKKVLSEGGFLYPGHTEYLAALCRNQGHEVTGPVMMLTARDLRVVPVTIHTALKNVPGQLTIDLLVNTGEVVVEALRRDFGIAEPRLAVAGLNPHAGEDGMLGDEEQTVITPAINRLRNRRHEVSGPSAADSLFHEAARKEYDAVLCMYHDQALIPLKTVDFWSGVNVTLGLPIVRTSPDHGTAFSLAASGKANAESMVAAIKMAAEIAANRAKTA